MRPNPYARRWLALAAATDDVPTRQAMTQLADANVSATAILAMRLPCWRRRLPMASAGAVAQGSLGLLKKGAHQARAQGCPIPQQASAAHERPIGQRQLAQGQAFRPRRCPVR